MYSGDLEIVRASIKDVPHNFPAIHPHRIDAWGIPPNPLKFGVVSQQSSSARSLTLPTG